MENSAYDRIVKQEIIASRVFNGSGKFVKKVSKEVGKRLSRYAIPGAGELFAFEDIVSTGAVFATIAALPVIRCLQDAIPGSWCQKSDSNGRSAYALQSQLIQDFKRGQSMGKF